jgi:hypothetical protein
MSNGKRSYGILSSVMVLFFALIVGLSCVGSFIWFMFNIWDKIAVRQILG